MKRKKYTAKLLSMAVAANLIFSSFAMPVVSAETEPVRLEAAGESGTAEGRAVSNATANEAAPTKETEKETQAPKVQLDNQTPAETLPDTMPETEQTLPSDNPAADAEDPAANPGTDPKRESGITPAADPNANLTTEPGTALSTEPVNDVSDPAVEPVSESATEPATNSGTEPFTETVTEPAIPEPQQSTEPSRAVAPVQITVSDTTVTEDTASLKVNLSSVPSSGILRIVQLDAGETYEQSKLNNYTSLHFSIVATLHAGENTLALTSKPTAGKQLLVVLRDSSGSGIVDYTSSPITVAAKETEDRKSVV